MTESLKTHGLDVCTEGSSFLLSPKFLCLMPFPGLCSTFHYTHPLRGIGDEYVTRSSVVKLIEAHTVICCILLAASLGVDVCKGCPNPNIPRKQRQVEVSFEVSFADTFLLGGQLGFAGLHLLLSLLGWW